MKPPISHFVCADAEFVGRGGDGEDAGLTVGPLKRTTTSAPDIDSKVPMILALVIELLKSAFSILHIYINPEKL